MEGKSRTMDALFVWPLFRGALAKMPGVKYDSDDVQIVHCTRERHAEASAEGEERTWLPVEMRLGEAQRLSGATRATGRKSRAPLGHIGEEAGTR